MEVLPGLGDIAIDSDCTFDLESSSRGDLERTCQSANSVPGEQGFGILVASSDGPNRVDMFAFDGDEVTIDGPDVVETASSGNVAVVIYRISSGRSTPVEISVDGGEPIVCDLDRTVRKNYLDHCK